MKTSCPVLLIAVLLPAACNDSDHASHAEEAPPPIISQVITTGDTDLTVHEQVVGTVQPELQATVSSKTIGRIIEMHAVPGKTVNAGDTLAKIEAPALEAALARADAALANAKSEAERYRALRDSGSVSRQEIERIETARTVAAAEREQINSQLAETTIKAPFTGRITRKDRDTGDLVQPGIPVCRIEDPSHLRFEMHVAETLAGQLKIGDRFRVLIGSTGLEMESPVAEISPAADTGSRTFLIKLDLPGEKSLLAGQFGRAFLPRATRKAIIIPETAVLQRGQLSYAGVVDEEDFAHLRIVRTGSRLPDGIEILAGLGAGERILEKIPDSFTSGTIVKPAH